MIWPDKLSNCKVARVFSLEFVGTGPAEVRVWAGYALSGSPVLDEREGLRERRN
jgi:hypothetical protein